MSLPPRPHLEIRPYARFPPVSRQLALRRPSPRAPLDPRLVCGPRAERERERERAQASPGSSYGIFSRSKGVAPTCHLRTAPTYDCTPLELDLDLDPVLDEPCLGIIWN